jgi:hypothetical protein
VKFRLLKKKRKELKEKKVELQHEKAEFFFFKENQDTKNPMNLKEQVPLPPLVIRNG